MGNRKPKGVFIRNGIHKNSKKGIGPLMQDALKVHDDVKSLFSSDIFVATGEELDENLRDADFAIFYDKNYFLCQLLERNGIRCFNSYQAIDNCDCKANMYDIFAMNDIPHAKTVIFPSVYYQIDEHAAELIDKTIEYLKFPMVAKTFHGAKGIGVEKIDNKDELIKYLKTTNGWETLFQEYVEVDEETPYDIRVVVIGSEIKCVVKRVAKEGDFRSNLAQGGHCEQIELREDEKALTLKIAKVFGCDYCGIDLMRTKNGTICCEINSCPGFEAAFKLTGDNLYNDLIEYVQNQY